MRRYFAALRPIDLPVDKDAVPEGLFLVRICRAQYHWHRRNPYYDIRFAILKPKQLTGSLINARLDCSSKAMWKVSWFLREFGYDAELLRSGEIDEQALVDLWGIINISHALVRGTPVLYLNAFASAEKWEEPTTAAENDPPKSEVPS